MDKSKAIIAALAFAAGAGAGTAISQPASPDLKIVNMKLVREDLPDAGTQWNGRACAYATTEKQTTEPCWAMTVPASGGTCIRAIEQLFIDGRKP